jgi:transketolase
MTMNTQQRELFEQQPLAWAGLHGAIIALDRFGASAPGPILFKEFGFSVQHVVERATQLASRR